MKSIVLSIVAVFLAWSALDFVIHGVILQSSYQATAQFWRPMNEMKMGVMYVAVLIAAVAFVCVYARFFGPRGIRTGAEYGAWFGLGAGVSMGYGAYAVMPIPYAMAFAWFLGTLVEGIVGGIITGAIIRK